MSNIFMLGILKNHQLYFYFFHSFVFGARYYVDCFCIGALECYFGFWMAVAAAIGLTMQMKRIAENILYLNLLAIER